MLFFINDMIWNARVVAGIALLTFLGILFTLRRLVSNEFAAREDVERLMFVLGYRKKDIVLYEEGYVMFDLCCGYAVAGIFGDGAGNRNFDWRPYGTVRPIWFGCCVS